MTEQKGVNENLTIRCKVKSQTLLEQDEKFYAAQEIAHRLFDGKKEKCFCFASQNKRQGQKKKWRVSFDRSKYIPQLKDFKSQEERNADEGEFHRLLLKVTKVKIMVDFCIRILVAWGRKCCVARILE